MFTLLNEENLLAGKSNNENRVVRYGDGVLLMGFEDEHFKLVYEHFQLGS